MDDNVTVYPYDKKKRLAKKISQLKKKEDMVKILEIIYADNKNITENQNGLFMFFDKLNDSTYHKIDLYLRSIVKKKISEEESSEKNKFTTYAKNEFSDTIVNHVSDNPKMKYSNREKNIIKRQRYSEQLNSENNTDSHVKYAKFDLSVLSDSESKKVSEEPVLLSEPTPIIDTITNIDNSVNPIEPVNPVNPIDPVKRPRGRPKKNVVVV